MLRRPCQVAQSLADAFDPNSLNTSLTSRPASGWLQPLGAVGKTATKTTLVMAKTASSTTSAVLAAAQKGLVHSTDSSVQVASFFDRSCPLLLCLSQLSLKCSRQTVRYAARLAVQ